MSSNYFYLAFIPMIVAQIIARVYLLKYLDKPANFEGAPWYVKLPYSSVVKLFDLRETVLFYFIGFIGFSVVFVMYIDHFIIGLLITLLFLLSAWFNWKAMVWMDENNRWGTRKPRGEENPISSFQHITKDSFLLFNSFIVVLIISLSGYAQLREYVRSKGQEAGKKDALEQIRQDSLQNLKNK